MWARELLFQDNLTLIKQITINEPQLKSYLILRATQYVWSVHESHAKVHSLSYYFILYISRLCRSSLLPQFPDCCVLEVLEWWCWVLFGPFPLCHDLWVWWSAQPSHHGVSRIYAVLAGKHGPLQACQSSESSADSPEHCMKLNIIVFQMCYGSACIMIVTYSLLALLATLSISLFTSSGILSVQHLQTMRTSWDLHDSQKYV